MPNVPPAPRYRSPERPRNALHTLSEGLGMVAGLPSMGINLLNEGFALATNSVSQALPSFPAATLGSMAVGIPHAHVLHPPSGPPPVPPTPMPVLGAIALGTSVQVLINGMPAARCGDLGFTPTCCGLPPIFEVFTGSSKVFIGGARAARLLDLTYHCKPVPPAGAAARGAAAALQAASKAMMVAGMAAQVASIAGDAVEAAGASAEGDAAMAGALGMSAGMMAAQMAADALAMAMGAAMGKDACVPPGTLGAVTLGAPNVLIGGFPMPSWMNVARGLMKLVKGLRARAGARRGRRNSGRNH
ncbi:PAAR domain-containing protein [Myxococcus faecalis]|uniref:PAAR domain-containing protein n=1 Tax=Myxococcus faecalis TaxID=3115646 RepID=UPI0024CDA9B6|nr:PAAR domain-containing protein [Myxococcus sp. MH1]